MTHVTLRIHEDGADDERIEQLTAFLRSELQDFAPVPGAAGEAPEGSKAVDWNELGTLLTTVSQSTVLAALINAVSAWLGQRRERSVTVEADGDALELTGAPTEEELARRSAWLGRHLHRYALIIASYEFADPGLSSLRAPAHDAARLGEVLADPNVGGFHVRTLINSSASEITEAVDDFFADREPDDLLVLHFSGHGVKDEAGELHFATSSTKLARLAGTAVAADFVARRMNRSRSRRIVLLLDCCYSGAFGRGMVARAGGAVSLEEHFGGRGRAVITASSSMEYAFEGATVADTSEGEPSVFTAALVEGLESGDADRDNDGHVGLDELYEYVYDRVRRVTPHQTPGKWMLDVRGDLRIARRARPVSVPAALPAELQDALDHALPGVRAGAVPELRRMLSVAHEGRVLAARLALRRLTEDDSRMVAAAAAEALGEKPRKPRPTSEKPKPVSPPPVAPLPVASPPPSHTGTPVAAPAAGQFLAVLPRLGAGLALALLVIGLATVSGGVLGNLGDTSPHTFVFAAVWPWALVAAVFAMTCCDHPWVPGAALGLLAGVTGLLSGTEAFTWIAFGLAAVVPAVAATSSSWLGIAGGGLGAVGVYVVAASASDLVSINGDAVDVTLVVLAVALTCLAVFRLWRDRAWPGGVAPGLLLLDAVLMLTAEVPPYVTHASLAALVVVPLIVVLTGGMARFAACAAVAAGLVVRANDFVSASEPTFVSVAHVTLPLAAAVIAYFARGR
ncbi:caspase family protein [Lentzea sp. CC55]|uniref:caspase family protein n=1 Tax=Lentzea sp. CC55 TaxID=2884909 RepID=UPI001F1C47D1|nr:caspase family protein [Lentzea sp. CC55]MCG8923345.1 caspase family protein [Lentzea sp. CC55]